VLGNHFHGEIEVLVCADEVARGKPAPDLYQRAAALLRKPAQACVAFEDSANGLRAARAAGLATVVTPSRWTMAQDFRGADVLRPDLNGQHLEEVRRIHQCKRPSLNS
jgi:beta-phosphoglucomutase-like phosphatase (HAD superfamily)